VDCFAEFAKLKVYRSKRDRWGWTGHLRDASVGEFGLCSVKEQGLLEPLNKGEQHVRPPRPGIALADHFEDVPNSV